MKQININVTKEFEQDLKFLMNFLNMKRKSDVIRYAVHEVAERIRRKQKFDFDALMGIALKYPANPNPRFKSEDDLWS